MTSPNTTQDADEDGCDDCSSGIEAEDGETPEPNNDGLDTDGDGICDAGEAAYDAASDHDGDGIPNEIDPCEYSDDNNTDGDGRCLIKAHHVGLFDDAFDPVDEQTQPAIGLAGRTPFVAYLTTDDHIKVVAIEETTPGEFGARVIDLVDPIEYLGTSNVGFRASGELLIVAPRAALTDEDDYYVYPFGGRSCNVDFAGDTEWGDHFEVSVAARTVPLCRLARLV